MSRIEIGYHIMRPNTEFRSFFFVSMFYLLGISVTLSAPTKLNCKNVNGSNAGPLELDLQNNIAYRFSQRQQWQITSIEDIYLTMTRLSKVGGSIATLDTSSGKLVEAEVTIPCVNLSTCPLTKVPTAITLTFFCSRNMLDY